MCKVRLAAPLMKLFYFIFFMYLYIFFTVKVGQKKYRGRLCVQCRECILTIVLHYYVSQVAVMLAFVLYGRRRQLASIVSRVKQLFLIADDYYFFSLWLFCVLLTLLSLVFFCFCLLRFESFYLLLSFLIQINDNKMDTVKLHNRIVLPVRLITSTGSFWQPTGSV